MTVWAYSCWRDGGGFVIASLSLTFGVVDLCGCLDFGGFRAVDHNGGGGIPRPQRCVGSLLHGAQQKLREEFMCKERFACQSYTGKEANGGGPMSHPRAACGTESSSGGSNLVKKSQHT
ncbi:hypothetical protein NDU88_002284 [Pleurodeles waltl]|uniref:Uncharacterized protein n=1 Tax=Pleurodeles waltl TaxID=8319 RepID=A0AAV7T1L8_PLEWA|nr:hypothetical protein NDU88_002284 [Pleurodeles waltl]